MSDTSNWSTYVEHPFLFDWHENEVQATLQLLHDIEPQYRAEMVEIMHDLRKSPKFDVLYSRFTDALFVAKKNADDNAEHEIMLAMFARIYVAGNLRRTPILDDVRLGES